MSEELLLDLNQMLIETLRMDLEAATEWLLGNSDDPDVDDPLTSEQKRQLAVFLRGPGR